MYIQGFSTGKHVRDLVQVYKYVRVVVYIQEFSTREMKSTKVQTLSKNIGTFELETPICSICIRHL